MNKEDRKDLVERLRNVTEDDAYALPWTFGETCREAAAEIERLMQEVALARATAREDLFPAMSSRIKAEREQARRQAFDEVGKKAREYAAHYPEASDGRNTFIIFAEWAEGRP